MPLFPSLLSLAVFAGSLTDTGHRRVLLIAPDTTDGSLNAQREILKRDTAGLKERDIIVSIVTPESDRKTYAAFHRNAKGFLFLLYGKDGDKKFSSATPVTLDQLYGIIDSMPMRVEEMKGKPQS